MALDSVRVSSISKRYGRHRALVDVDLELRAGELCALVGENGAGKSTLLGIVSTLVRADRGQVVYESKGQSVTSGSALRAEIGVVAHESLIYRGLSALENLHFWGKLYGVPELETRVEVLLREVELDASAWDRPASTFSRGMLQRLSLARTLLPQPSLLLLDEPFTGLDRQGSRALGRTLQSAVNKGSVVLVVTHDFEAIAGVTKHLAILRRGKLAHQERNAQFSLAALRDCYHEHCGD